MKNFKKMITLTIINMKIIKLTNKLSKKKFILQKTNVLQRTKFMSHGILFVSWNSANSTKNWTTTLQEFYHLWSFQQWASSLISLILLYWITGFFYNKWLSKKGGWLNWQTRIWLIISDLAINLALGIYYMGHRDTILGSIMVSCPISISPLIFILELVCVYIYHRFGKTSKYRLKT